MFACENCSQVFDNGKLLLDHRVKEYCSTTCWRCTRAFKHRQELSSHQQNVTNINCKICEDKFCNKKDYQEHQIYIHGVHRLTYNPKISHYHAAKLSKK